MSLPTPPLFLRVRAHPVDPSIVGLCVGYELKKWRDGQFANHLLDWLPEFAFTSSEFASIGGHNLFRRASEAAKNLYTSAKYKNRGECGELILHAAMRQVFNTVPAISKLYFKDSPNDTVKGFDAVHVVAKGNDLELWLGESKFYSDLNGAVADLIKSLSAHTTKNYFRSEFAAIARKTDKEWPHAARLQSLLDPNTSLDDVFTCMRFPVLITYDSAVIKKHKVACDEYVNDFNTEVAAHASQIKEKLPALPVSVELLLLPMRNKQDFVKKFDAGLKRAQRIYDAG